MRECGLKLSDAAAAAHGIAVTPCAGVWIEILTVFAGVKSMPVTPCAGVWIEITGDFQWVIQSPVTPCAGVWIEIRIANVREC